ncbi:cysteine desulfurase family protein [Lihuaxuella thermophila]|uniref:cysteine desulfurase n=1 Tax=Lihuaxuella thermophila TaxID=1173111 RepID=A0A1H8ATG5_9BACL|nr:cysteine desulfurase family protein [Lihuaxuella thermophila]SEM73098.1 cysteine desulfurase [Lihuaxuella thermophila]
MTIYLDHAATTPIRPEVREAMLPYLGESFGNPSSIHQFGRTVRMAMDRAREQVAGGLNAEPGQIIFTSGGTEADNLALMGVATAYSEQGKKHIITSRIEHHAILDTCRFMERMGFEVTYIPVDRTGLVDVEALKKAIRSTTALISVMYGNNEVGTLQPIEEIGQIARERGVLFHTDAVQAFGMEEIDVKKLPVDLLSVSSHKINGPKGAGALYVSKNVKLVPRAFGGSQERRRRAGTENVPGIVGFGKAAEIAAAKRTEHRKQMLELRETLIGELARERVNFVINGHPKRFLPHILNVSFPGTETETMLMNLDLEGVACASGSACTSGTLEVSHVLEAMDLSDELTRSAIRFSFGWGNTLEEMRRTAMITARIVRRLTIE